jgi:hypothetical protein
MKKYVAIFFLLFLTAVYTKGQDIKETEGKYFQNGRPYTGVLNEYFSNGTIKTEINLKNGLKNGKVVIYSETGQILELRSYRKNEMHGNWIVFNEKGTKTSLANYKNGKKHGKWMIWNDSGTLIYELHYLNGEKTGTWKSYDKEGSLINERKY